MIKKQSDLGCNVDEVYIADLMYADDLLLVSATCIEIKPKNRVSFSIKYGLLINSFMGGNEMHTIVRIIFKLTF